jgi:sarcosine oxidase subunit alpha
MAAAADGLALIDQSARGKLFVKGEAAAGVLAAVWPIPTLAINQGALTAAGAVYRLRPDLFLVNTAVAGETAVQAQLEAAIQAQGAFVTVTDGTHGRFQFQLSGDKSPDLLRRLCGLDFDDFQFPNLTAKQSSVANTTQIILRRDAGESRAYFLMGGRSLGLYVWQVLVQAGRDLGIIASP